MLGFSYFFQVIWGQLGRILVWSRWWRVWGPAQLLVMPKTASDSWFRWLLLLTCYHWLSLSLASFYYNWVRPRYKNELARSCSCCLLFRRLLLNFPQCLSQHAISGNDSNKCGTFAEAEEHPDAQGSMMPRQTSETQIPLRKTRSICAAKGCHELKIPWPEGKQI